MVEQLTLNQLVLGSSPSRGTNFAKENEQVGQADTLPTQETPESIEAIVKWPKKVKHRNQVLDRIYRPCEGRGSYRVAWSVNGKRMMKSFRTYGGKGGALEYAEGLVGDLTITTAPWSRGARP